jgi:hypothetical protein
VAARTENEADGKNKIELMLHMNTVSTVMQCMDRDSDTSNRICIGDICGSDVCLGDQKKITAKSDCDVM